MAAKQRVIHVRFVSVRLILFGVFAVAPILCAQQSSESSIQQIGAQAMEMESEGRFDQAAMGYKRILEIDPHSLAALNRLGALYVRQGNFAEGIAYYRQALNFEPHNFGTNLNLGIAFLKEQDYHAATKPLAEAATAQPDNLQARQLLALSFVGQEDYERAIPVLEQIGRENPADAGNLYLLSRAYLQTKRFQQALATFDALDKADPNSAWVHLLKGQALDGLAQYDKAVEEFRVASQQQPNDATVRFSLGFLLWKTQDFGGAETELARAVALDPTFREAKFYLADAYLADQKPEPAIPLLQSVLSEDANNVRARLDLGKAFSLTGSYPEAATQLEAAVRLQPKRAEAHYQLARVYQKLNQPAKFRQELETAKSLQTEKLHSDESVMSVTGARGDATQQLGLTPRRDAVPAGRGPQ